jgi:hypothetical protein
LFLVVVELSPNDDGRSELVRLTVKGLRLPAGISEIARSEHEIEVMDRAFRKLLSIKAIEIDEVRAKKGALRKCAGAAT